LQRDYAYLTNSGSFLCTHFWNDISKKITRMFLRRLNCLSVNSKGK